MATPYDPAVERAVHALRAFHVDQRTSERRIRAMLRTWAHHHTLTAEQVDQVVTEIRGGAQ